MSRAAEWAEAGVIAPIRVLDADEVTQAQRDLAELEQSLGPIQRFANGHLHVPWIHRLATHPRLLDAVAGVLGDDLLIHGGLILGKPAGDLGFVSWHQDSRYSQLDRTPSLSAWLALTSSDRTSGCMRVVPGSHRLGRLDHDERPSASNLLRRGETVAMAIDEASVRELILAPGELSLHHPNLLHGSGPNASDRPRVGLIVRFVSSACTRENWPMLRARGSGDAGHLLLVAPPDPELSLAEALAGWRTDQS
jgi:non-heme Fe2+,alpha-ketoglutarate-dependent halogenase